MDLFLTPRWISRRTSWGGAPRIWIRQVFKCPYQNLGRLWGCYPWKRQTHAPIANTLYKKVIGQSMSLLPPGARRLDRGLVRRHRPMPEVFHSHRDNHTDSDSFSSSEADAPGETLGQIRHGVLWGIRGGISRELIRTLGVILGATVWAWASPRITLMGLELIPWRSPDGYPRGTITVLPPGSLLGASVSHPTSAQE